MKTKFRKCLAPRKHTASRFLRNEAGTFVPTFAIAVMALFASVGAAVDYTQLSRTKTIVNQSLDAAVLATGNELLKGSPNDEALEILFNDYLYANLAAHGELADRVTVNTFNVDQDTGTISAELTTPVNMAFMPIFGKDQMPVHSATEAVFSTNPVEISMMLDVTGSMRWDGKLDALKLAAKDAIDILLPADGPASKVRVGLVPYAAGVNGGQFAKTAIGSNKTCATERITNQHNDTSYLSSPLRSDPNASCPSAKVVPLTDNARRLKNKISAFQPDGYTAGHLGIGWSYYMLSERWQSLWPEQSKPADYGGKTKKIAILMTDGEFNTFYRGVSSGHQGGQTNLSNQEAIALCNDMKAPKAGGDGITVYSVAFNAPASAKTTLQACATPDDGATSYYYDANSDQELRTAFREIANSIKVLRLSK